MEIQNKILELAPWHLDVKIGDISTSIGKHESIGFVSNEVQFKTLVKTLYPNGVSSFLDCACNCGAYSFWMEDLGAECYGTDIHEHWIKQAFFLQEALKSKKTRFELKDIRDMDLSIDRQFCLFKGIFYHLADPVLTLRKICDTIETILIDTSYKVGYNDGFLKLEREKDTLMNGVDNLNWYPTGPEVIRSILDSFGMSSTIYFIRPESNRLGIIGSHNKEIINNYVARS